MDFLTSCSTVWVTVAGMARLSANVRSAVQIGGVLLVAGIVRHSRTALSPILVPIGVGAILVVSNHRWHDPRYVPPSVGQVLNYWNAF
jgi:hypothetical protein